LDKISGRQATNCTPAAAKQNLGGSSAPNSFSVDPFYPPGAGANSSSSSSSGIGSDDVHSCSDDPPSITIVEPSGSCDNSCTITATPFSGTHPLNDSQYQDYPGTVAISVNGKNICTSTTISSGKPVSCSYSPDFNGPGTIKATVSDSVLYQGSDSSTINFSGGGGGGGGSVSFNDVSNINASWSGGTGPYVVTRNDTNATICSVGVGEDSCTFNTVLPNNTFITITDNGTGDTDTKKVHP
jgi:hypothetical protein